MMIHVLGCRAEGGPKSKAAASIKFCGCRLGVTSGRRMAATDRTLPPVPVEPNDRNRRNGDPERAAPKVRFRYDRRHSRSAGDLPGDLFHDFPGWVRPAFSKVTYLIGFTLDNRFCREYAS